MKVEYRNLPDVNDLFLDYISEPSKVEAFFNGVFSDPAAFSKVINQKKNNYPPESITRNVLCDILTKQNKLFGAGEKVFLNIEKLRNEKTFAVVTGQQVGILTGNIYTLYKAINTLQLSNLLSEKYPDYQFVPVFWMETDDHDFLEVNSINVLNAGNKIQKISYFENGQEQERYLKPISSIVFDNSITKFIDELQECLLETEFSPKLIDLIRDCYQPGVSFPVAFGRFFQLLLGDVGIILLNPADIEIKNLVIPIFEKELRNYPRSCESVIEISAVIEQTYEPQVKPRPINLFFTYQGNRYAIEPKTDGAFGLRNSRQKFSEEELFSILYTNPECFSPNVVLRPITQDYLLPTVTYIAGPSEIAYFSQLKEVYSLFDVPMPIIYPRSSVTLVERRVAAFFDKYELPLELFYEEGLLRNKMMYKVNEIKVEDIFADYFDEINAVTYKLTGKIEQIDKSLTEGLKNRKDKYLEIIENFQRKFLDVQAKLNETNVSKLQTYLNMLYPEGVLQERFFNITYFVNKYGFDFITRLIESIQPGPSYHQLITIAEP
ncbi:MAG: bacillithiol biosynthesis cysteine-adding enzyme BshC [Ignavibacteria bacterium]